MNIDLLWSTLGMVSKCAWEIFLRRHSFPVCKIKSIHYHRHPSYWDIFRLDDVDADILSNDSKNVLHVSRFIPMPTCGLLWPSCYSYLSSVRDVIAFRIQTSTSGCALQQLTELGCTPITSTLQNAVATSNFAWLLKMDLHSCTQLGWPCMFACML